MRECMRECMRDTHTRTHAQTHRVEQRLCVRWCVGHKACWSMTLQREEKVHAFAYRLLDFGIVIIAMHAAYQGLDGACFNKERPHPARPLLSPHGNLPMQFSR